MKFKTFIKKYKKISIVFFIILFLCLCNFIGNNRNHFDFTNSIYSELKGDMFEKSSNEVMDSIDSLDALESYSEVGEIQEDNDLVSPELSDLSSEKLIYNASVDIDVKDFKKFVDLFKSDITKYNGIIESESMYNDAYSDSTKYLSLIVRIPQEHYEEFLNELNENSDIVITNLSKNVSNFTKYYYDIESRITSLRVQEKRLLELLKQSADVSDMITVESKLSDVQYEIDTLNNSLKDIDTDVSYSTINISINEVNSRVEPSPQSLTFFERLLYILEDSFFAFLASSENCLTGFIYLLPYLIIGVVFFIVIKKIIKLKRNKSNKSE